jgi:hypothetical protein
VLFGGIVVAYLLGYSAWRYWEGGYSYGPRFLLPCLPLAMIVAAHYLDQQPNRTLVWSLAILGAVVQVLGVVVSYVWVLLDWERAGIIADLRPGWLSQHSSISTHLLYLLHGRHIDLWFATVYRTSGLAGVLLTLAIPLLLFAASLRLLVTSRVLRAIS